MRSAFAAALALSGVVALTGVSASEAAGVPNRAADPIVITGADTPALVGTDPGRIVAFSRSGGAWQQVPVQVDERAVIDYRAVRQTTGFSPFSNLAYTDPGTFAGADPDPTLDGDDEIAAMAMDSGDRSDSATDPGGVDPATRIEIEVTDPLQPGSAAYLYLFRSNGSLDPSAGKRYVDYAFSLNSGDYKTTYDWNGVGDSGGGPPANPENSIVTTPFYSQHLLSRWVEDELHITAGGGSGVDILDGDKAQVSYGCMRSELTFSRGGGGFIVNKSGPVRAIRSYIGANSGTFTQRDQIYYERAEVTQTFLRVHQGISTVSQFLDYSPAATGMTYRNSARPTGATIDGTPDPSLETGNALGPPIAWEQASGAQGSLTLINRVVTDLPAFTAGSFYHDKAVSPTTMQCGGYADAAAYGSSGPAFTSSGANTDPTLGAAYSLTGTRTIFYGAPGAGVADAELRSTQVDSPLQLQVSADTARARLRVFGPPARPAKVGKTKRVRVRVENRGAAGSGLVSVCAKGARRLVKVGACAKVERLAAGGVDTVRIRVRLRRAAAREQSVRLSLVARPEGAEPARDHARLKPA